MMLKKLIAWTLVLYLALILTTLFIAISQKKIDRTPVPNFAAIEDIPSRKQAFFNFLKPLVETENQKILKDRKVVKKLASSYNKKHKLTKRQIKLLTHYAHKYYVLKDDEQPEGDPKPLLDELLLRVDSVPPAMALAQAANESSWGRSRFAQHGNNYFGQWCYTEGCGIVPGKRSSGATHEVRRFRSPRASVASYLKNINTHTAYQQLRQIRADLRSRKAPITAYALAAGLMKYSERGEAYVSELRAMIKSNNLE
ncbi:Bax protein [Alteromonadaceae bacterium 2753L.S.0a.02]|nr:Bax protein [Alteromonadaceae bacterium 2753L.S.0a.02]